MTSVAPDVLVDATAIPPDRGGVGRYVDELLRALDAAGTPVTIVCQERDAERFRATCPSSPVVPIAGIEGRARRLVWEQASLPRLARHHGARLIHSPHYTIPLATRRRRTVVFHDATFWSEPDAHTSWTIWFH